MSDMIQLTRLQTKIMDVIEANPGVMYGEILKISGVAHGNGTGTITSLLKKEIVRREGTTHKYKYYSTGMAYTVVERVVPKLQIAPNPMDWLLEKSLSVRLTDEQRFYVKHHKHVPRTKLAARLGLTKLELNFAIALNR